MSDQQTAMTTRQLTAILFPCARATETTHPRYFAYRGAWSTLLTINK